jgi:hypothetical protein
MPQFFTVPLHFNVILLLSQSKMQTLKDLQQIPRRSAKESFQHDSDFDLKFEQVVDVQYADV